MKIYTKSADHISQDFLNEIEHTIDGCHELCIPAGFPLPIEQGLTIVGSELYDPPFVACISIPMPRTVDEASQMYWRWMKLVSQALQLPDVSVTPVDVRNQLIDMIINDSYKCDINPDRITQLGAFLVSHLKGNGLSFDEQVKRNKQHIVTGHFFLITKDNRIHIFSDEVGHRMDGVELR